MAELAFELTENHYPFWVLGVPVCFPIFLPLPPEYHQPVDVLDRVQSGKIDTIVDLVDALARELDAGAPL